MTELLPTRQLCTHCEKKRTRRQDGGGHPVCAACEMSLLPDIEQPRHCPEDGGVMVKEPVLNGEVFIERCPHCKGVFVPPKELEILNNEFTRNRETTYFTMLVASMVSG